MRAGLTFLLLLVLVGAHLFTFTRAERESRLLFSEDTPRPTLPSFLVKLTSSEYDGILADFYFLRTLTFYGQTYEREDAERIKAWEWQWMFHSLDVATDLDPYFFDPYYFANANLTWEGRMAREANELLAKGLRHRTWDWMIPFYMGFNSFYFLKDPAEGAEYLMEASRRPGAGPVLTTLAARLAYQGNRTEEAVVFLQGMMATAVDDKTRIEFERRLKALKAIHLLEQSLAAFEEKFNLRPQTLDELVTRGILPVLPEDPYGGEFYIEEDGSVKTTSNLLRVRPQADKKKG
jgi:hypothetical protein